MERPRLGKGQNYHHLFYTRRSYDYTDNLQEAFREHPAFVIPMIKEVHKDLHDWIEPPPKPTRYQMYAMLGDLALFRPKERTEGIYLAIKTLDILARIDGEPSENALEIADHLNRQLVFINEGNPYASATEVEWGRPVLSADPPNTSTM